MNLPKQSVLEYLAAFAVTFLLGLLVSKGGRNPFDHG